MTITTSHAQSTDLSDLLQLYERLHPGETDLSLEHAAHILDQFDRYPGSSIIITRLDTQLVSTAALVVIPNLTRNGMPYALIENVVTDPAYRRRGFASRTITHAIEIAWEYGCYKVMLMSGAKNPDVLRFYSDIGFEQSKTGFQIRRIAKRES